ncbi:MAG TPA: hypothetical protein VHM65_01420 [Candidatus Lustribacter sp.]|nr:hypothetical protein [Candidatus Lustribacter sp.]
MVEARAGLLPVAASVDDASEAELSRSTGPSPASTPTWDEFRAAMAAERRFPLILDIEQIYAMAS